MADVMLAKESKTVTVDGEQCRVRRNRSTADSDAKVVKEHPDLWRVLPIDFPAEKGTGGSKAASTAKKASAPSKATGAKKG